MSIGERISELRKEKKISQGQLANLLDISRQAVSKWENDLSSPDTANLIRLADVLDTDVEYLASGRRSYARRPPIVIRSTEVVERIVEKPAPPLPFPPQSSPIDTQTTQQAPPSPQKPIIRYVNRPVIQYVDKPVIKTVTRTKYLRNPIEFTATAILSLLLGILIGYLAR